MHRTRLFASAARGLLAALVLAAAAPALADQQWPAQTPEGLTLRKSTEYGAVYVKDGADFGQYPSVGRLECLVQFAKNWARDYNANEPDLANQITPDDEKRIQSFLSAEFNKEFVTELSKNSDFQIVTQQAAGVLMLRPALINVIVTAPDLNVPEPSLELIASNRSDSPILPIDLRYL